MHKKPLGIIFDWDNTLVDTWPLIHNALCKTFISRGMTPWTIEETIEYSSRSLTDYFPKLFGNTWEEAREVFYEEYYATRFEDLRALPYVEELLLLLAKMPEIYIAVVSNKKGEILRKEAEIMGWTGYFPKLIGSMDTEEDKPSKLPVLAALQGSNLKPSEDIWFIGDSYIDVECARNSGCLPIFYGTKDRLKKYDKGHLVNYIIESHKEVILALEALVAAN